MILPFTTHAPFSSHAWSASQPHCAIGRLMPAVNLQTSKHIHVFVVHIQKFFPNEMCDQKTQHSFIKNVFCIWNDSIFYLFNRYSSSEIQNSIYAWHYSKHFLNVDLNNMTGKHKFKMEFLKDHAFSMGGWNGCWGELYPQRGENWFLVKWKEDFIILCVKHRYTYIT